MKKSRGNPQIYFDIKIGKKDAGRIICELRADVVPVTVGEIYSCPVEARQQMSVCNFIKIQELNDQFRPENYMPFSISAEPLPRIKLREYSSVHHSEMKRATRQITDHNG
jgi:hypothetical protein